MLKNYAQHLVAIIGILFLISFFTYNLNFSEHPLINKGLGWDGYDNYAPWATAGPIDLLKNKKLTEYYTHRILPATIIYYANTIVKSDFKQPNNIIRAFQIYNDTLILLAAILLFLISKHLHWKPQTLLIGFSALFFNFSILKFSNYYPVLTDVSGFFWSILIFYFYLKDRIILLLLAIVSGFFVFPDMVYLFAPLVFFPIKNYQNIPITISQNPRINLIITIIFAAILTFAAVLLIPENRIIRPEWKLPIVNDDLLPLSALCLFTYLVFAFGYLIDINYWLTKIKSSINLQRGFIASIFILAIQLVINNFSKPNPFFLNIDSYLSFVLASALTAPFFSLVSHIMFFGPIVIVNILLWKDITNLVKQYGYGMLVFSCIAIAMFLAPESRELVNITPIFAILACEALNKKKTSWNFVGFFIITSLVVSRFWLQINYTNWGLNLNSNRLDFPLQNYFMNTGTWLSYYMYKIFFAVDILIAVGIFNMLKADRLSEEIKHLNKN